MTTLICRDDRQRREKARASDLNGLDYLEVSEDQRTLTVYFLGKAPKKLDRKNFLIEGGRRIRDIKVVGIKTYRNPDPELDDFVAARLDKFGDFSTYTLRLVGVQEPIDPRYDHLDFSFKVNCPGDLDCKIEDVCPPEPRPKPEINYLAKDYASFRQLILDRLALIMPEWSERHVPDVGIALVELLAYTGDYLSYYQDAVATEAYLDTARRRVSVRRHARLVDYRVHEGCNARAWVCIELSESAETAELNPADVFFITSLDSVLPTAARVLSVDELRAVPIQAYEVFEPLVADPGQSLELRSAHNAIPFYTWGERECCLPKGATSATLRDRWTGLESPPEPQYPSGAKRKKYKEEPPKPERRRALALKPNDVLIFEELVGPRTGNPANADPGHRHAVRLIEVEAAVDPLDDAPVVEITWSIEDALPFALCLSATTDAEHGCVYRDNVSIARGNIVLADHGRTIEPPESLGAVPLRLTQAECECDCPGRPGDVALVSGPFRPPLSQSPLTFYEPPDYASPASRALEQDPRAALPQVTLTSSPGEGKWNVVYDLLGSETDDKHFVVEIDNERRAHLRFGANLDAGMRFVASYRVGNGRVGNVGSEAIRHIVYKRKPPTGIDGVRNPLSAWGGTDPEPISDIKMFAPSAFRRQLLRAITPNDYARIAQRNLNVQRAAAQLRWTGSWYEVQVAVDPVGSGDLHDDLRKEIEDDLYPFRRIGYDTRVVSARYVPLDITIELCLRPDYLRGHVRKALLDVFGSRTLPSGQRGFFHPDNLTFGDGIYLSQLIATAQAVEGVESARVSRLQRQFQPANHEIEDGVLPLGPLEVARCDNDPSFPDRGRFELIVRGGR